MTFLRLYVLRTFWHTSAICVVCSNLKDSFHLAQKMELNCEHFRAIIFYIFQRGWTQQQCIDELKSIFGDKAPSRTSVYRWYGEFNRFRSSLQDEFRERPGNHWDQHTFNSAWIFDCQKNFFVWDSTQFVNLSKKSINQSDKSALTIGSKAFKSV